MTADNSKIINYLIRMVVPLRREFSLNLNVSQFCHDLAYAKQVLDTALSSQNPTLKEQAEYVKTLTFGPRTGNPGSAKIPPPLATPSTLEPLAALPSSPSPSSALAVKREKPSQARESLPANPPTLAATPLTPEEEMKALILKKYTSGLR